MMVKILEQFKKDNNYTIRYVGIQIIFLVIFILHKQPVSNDIIIQDG